MMSCKCIIYNNCNVIFLLRDFVRPRFNENLDIHQPMNTHQPFYHFNESRELSMMQSVTNDAIL